MQFNSTKYYALLFCCLTTASTLLAKDVLLKDAQQNLSGSRPCFIENKGQVTNQFHKVRTDIQYKLKSTGVNLFLSAGELHYQFNNVTGSGKNLKDNAYRMDVSLLGANKNATAVTADNQVYEEHYNQNGKMVTARSFGRVTYMDVYPGIDWSLYVKNDKVEYDFIVHSGADASKIQLKYGGASSIKIAENGGLIVKTPSGEINEKTPFTYAVNDNKEVGSSFSLTGNVLSFNVASHNGSIVIDPQLQWSTYYGGTSSETLSGVVTDASGNVFACGYTTSTTNIATTGTYQTTLQGSNDCFLVKFNGAGAIVWATYFGGTASDQANGVTTDKNGNVYIAGQTSSATLIATASAYQTTNGGASDGFLAKFNSAGIIQWSTYYGGTGQENIYAVACDRFRSVYITGTTTSTANIATTGAFSTTFSGSTVGFTVRFDTAGNRIWGTYYGSGTNSFTLPQTISADPAGGAYFAGYEFGSANLATPGAYQATGVTTNYNAFLTKFDSTGNRVWGTYFGGASSFGYAVANDTLGNVYLSGTTSNTTAIASAGAYQTTLGGSNDGYLAKFDTAGNFKWGTYYGGTGSENQKGIAVDNFGNPMISGISPSTTGIASTNNGVYQSTIGGGQDEYIAKFTPFGQRMWGTYFGGTLNENGGFITNNPVGGFNSAGYTNSQTGISTTGAYQVTNNGGNDAYISRFNRDTFVVVAQPYVDTIVCPGGSFNLAYNTSYAFNAGNTFTAQLSNASGSFAIPMAIGTVTANGTAGNILVTIPAGTATGTGYRIRIIATTPAYTSPDEFVNINIISGLSAPAITSNSPICVGDSIKLKANNTSSVNPVTVTTTGPNGFSSTSQTPYIAFANTSNAGTYTASAVHNGCPAVTASVNVAVNSTIPPAPTATSNTPICSGSALTINASSTVSPVTYRITGPHGFVANAQNAFIPNADTSRAGYYYIIDSLNGCRSAKDSILITVNQSVTATVNVTAVPGDSICAGGTVSFIANAANAGNNPLYQWRLKSSVLGDTAIVGAISNVYASSALLSGDIVYCILHSNAQCLANTNDTSNMVAITILQPYTPIVTIFATPGSSIAQGTAVTFTSAVVHGGSNPSYQWYINGHAVANATLNNITFHALADSDVVTLIVHNNVMCAAPDSAVSNAIRIHINNVGVNNIEEALGSINLYPNPTTGSMVLNGNLAGVASQTVQLEILNAIGQVVYTNNIAVRNGKINAPVQLSTNVADGTYLLRISADGVNRIMRFTVQR